MNEFNLHLGAQVHCVDSECGKLAKVAVDPITWQVTDLVVEEGRLLKQSYVFPFSTIIYTESNNIHLSLFRDDLETYPEYSETTFERPALGWDGRSQYRAEGMGYPTFNAGYDPGVIMVKEKIRQGIPSESEVVVKGTPIKNFEGILGKLAHLKTDQEMGQITHLIMQQGLLFPEYLNIPVTFIESISAEGIFITLAANELEGFRLLPKEQHLK